jgi:transcriptional regulator with XRE-family HTH domain
MARTVTPLPIPLPQLLQDAETLGKFVRASRTQNGMGIHEAAAFCGVSVSTMTKLEKASGDVRLSTLLQVCRMLGVTLRIETGLHA